jgi:hypothetical protein
MQIKLVLEKRRRRRRKGLKIPPELRKTLKKRSVTVKNDGNFQSCQFLDENLYECIFILKIMLQEIFF